MCPLDLTEPKPTGFRTDTEIASSHAHVGGLDRDLERWEPSGKFIV